MNQTRKNLINMSYSIMRDKYYFMWKISLTTGFLKRFFNESNAITLRFINIHDLLGQARLYFVYKRVT